jgi:hypothetical protein
LAHKDLEVLELAVQAEEAVVLLQTLLLISMAALVAQELQVKEITAVLEETLVMVQQTEAQVVVVVARELSVAHRRVAVQLETAEMV